MQVCGLLAAWYLVPLTLLLLLVGSILLFWVMRRSWIFATLSLLSLISFWQLRNLQEVRRQFEPYVKQSVTIKAQVYNIVPVATKMGHKVRFTLLISAINNHLIKPALLTMYLRYYPRCRIGDEIQLNDFVLGNDSKKLFFKENIAWCTFAGRLNFQVAQRSVFSWSRIINEIRWSCMRRLAQGLSPASATCATLIFTGAVDGGKEKKQLADLFCLWGISHHLARSGLHVALLMVLWYWLLTLCGIPYWGRQLIMFIMALIYALFTFPSISLWRAMTFVCYRQILLLAGYPSDGLSLLGLTASTLLFLFPASLFAADFQLTVGLTAALMILARYLPVQD